jgi:hypothetical protein
MGDRRSGRRLLQDGAADAAVTLRGLSPAARQGYLQGLPARIAGLVHIFSAAAAHTTPAVLQHVAGPEARPGQARSEGDPDIAAAAGPATRGPTPQPASIEGPRRRGRPRAMPRPPPASRPAGGADSSESRSASGRDDSESGAFKLPGAPVYPEPSRPAAGPGPPSPDGAWECAADAAAAAADGAARATAAEAEAEEAAEDTCSSTGQGRLASSEAAEEGPLCRGLFEGLSSSWRGDGDGDVTFGDSSFGDAFGDVASGDDPFWDGWAD